MLCFGNKILFAGSSPALTLVCVCYFQTAAIAGILIETVDDVTVHVARNLGGSPSTITVEGTSAVAGEVYPVYATPVF